MKLLVYILSFVFFFQQVNVVNAKEAENHMCFKRGFEIIFPYQEGVFKIKKEIHFPHSLGLLYSAFTYYTGFKVNSGEYKLMGLAPYGKPVYEDKIKKLVDIKEDGTFRLDQ